MIISAIQPYFFPYSNYYNLFKYSDKVVILDNVQFPRRGWVHRNKFLLDTNCKSNSKWLTLPLKKSQIETKINNLNFVNLSKDIFKQRTLGLDFFKNKITKYKKIEDTIFNFDCSVLEYLINNLRAICYEIKVPFKIIMQSDLEIDHTKKKEELILEIVKYFQAKTYVNLPGGKKIYKKESFAKYNCELKFLDNYKGNYLSILDNLNK